MPFSSAQSIPDESRLPLPKPSDAESREARVSILAARWAKGQQLWHDGDWVGDLAVTSVHDEAYWQGDDRRANGTDRPANMGVRDPFDEFADDHQELPAGWLDEELAAWRMRFRAPVPVLRSAAA